MSDTIHLSKLSDTLDTYMTKIEKVQASKALLSEQAEGLGSLIKVVDILTQKIDDLTAVGSPRASILKEIRHGVLAGEDVSDLLSRESRAATMRPDGVSGLSVSEVDMIRSASKGFFRPSYEESQEGVQVRAHSQGVSPVNGFSLPSPAALSLDTLSSLQNLTSWSVEEGHPPTIGGMTPVLESRLLKLGGGLTSGGSKSLVKDIEEDASREQQEESAEGIQRGTDALLSALGALKQKASDAVVRVATPTRRISDVVPNSWWSTLKTVGLVLGASTGIFGLLGDESVQRFLQENIFSGEGRRALLGKLESAFSSFSSRIEDFLSLGERINARLEQVSSLMASTGEGAVQQASVIGLSAYNTLSPDEQKNIRSFQSDYEKTLSLPKPLPAGIRHADVSALKTGLSSVALQAGGYFAGVETASAGFKGLRDIYKGVRGLASASRAGRIYSGFRAAFLIGHLYLRPIQRGVLPPFSIRPTGRGPSPN